MRQIGVMRVELQCMLETRLAQIVVRTLLTAVAHAHDPLVRIAVIALVVGMHLVRLLLLPLATTLLRTLPTLAAGKNSYVAAV